MDADLEVLHHHNHDHSGSESDTSDHGKETRERLKEQDDISVSKKDAPLAEALGKLSVDDVPTK